MRLHAPLFACAISLLAGCSSYVRPPFTGADLWTRGAIDGARLFVEDYGYAQLKPGQDSLPGAVYTQSGTDWWAEVEWQHSCGYQCAFGISVLTSVPGCPSNEAQYPCPTTACPQR